MGHGSLWRTRFVPAKGGFILLRKADYTGPPWNPHDPISAITIVSRLPGTTLPCFQMRRPSPKELS